MTISRTDRPSDATWQRAWEVADATEKNTLMGTYLSPLGPKRGDIIVQLDIAAYEIVVAANTTIRLKSNWETYTCNWGITSFGGPPTTAPAINDGTIVAKKMYAGTTVFFSIIVTLGAASTIGSGVAYVFDLPESIASGATIFANAQWHDAGVAAYFGQGISLGGTDVAGFVLDVSVPSQNWGGPAYPFVPGVSDAFILVGNYEF